MKDKLIRGMWICLISCAEKLCVFVSFSAALPFPRGQTAVSPKARISPLRRQTLSQAHPKWQLQSQSLSHLQPTTDPHSACFMWPLGETAFGIFHPSIPFYSVWLCFCHPAYSSKYKCKKMYLYKCLKKVTQYSSMTFTYTEERTSRAGSDEWMKSTVKLVWRSGTRDTNTERLWLTARLYGKRRPAFT